jgi:FtsZ-interacting cell division protein ZipA
VLRPERLVTPLREQALSADGEHEVRAVCRLHPSVRLYALSGLERQHAVTQRRQQAEVQRPAQQQRQAQQQRPAQQRQQQQRRQLQQQQAQAQQQAAAQRQQQQQQREQREQAFIKDVCRLAAVFERESVHGASMIVEVIMNASAHFAAAAAVSISEWRRCIARRRRVPPSWTAWT